MKQATWSGEAESTKADNGQSNCIDHSNNSVVNSDRESVKTSRASQENGDTISKPLKKTPHWSIRLLKLIVNQWFLISLGLVIVIASQVQVPLSQQETKSTVVSYLCISIIFFLTGLTLNTNILLDNYTRWKLHLFVQIECYLLTSSVVFAIITLCSLNENFMDPGLLLGLLLAGCTPTTIASNVIMTEQAHGTKALTVVQSTLGNFLAPFLTPPLFNMYLSGHPWYESVLPEETGGYGAIYRRVFKQLGLSLFVPMFVGQIIQNVFPKFTKRYVVDLKITKLSPLCLLIVVWQIYDQAFSSHVFETVKADNIIFIVFISLALFMVLNGIAFLTSILWLKREDVVSVCYCVPAKSPAMGVPLAMTMFVGLDSALQAKLQLPMVIYQALQIVGGTLLVPMFKRWVDNGKRATELDENEKEKV